MSTDLIITGFGAVIVLLLTLAGFLFNRWMADLSSKIQAICATNEKDHDELWRAYKDHDHVIRGNPTGGYETAGLIVSGH